MAASQVANSVGQETLDHKYASIVFTNPGIRGEGGMT
jgi:hypothetical protein